MSYEEKYQNLPSLRVCDYDRWFEPCKKCGFDTGRAGINSKPICWRCGNQIRRDYSKRALKQKFK